MQTFVCRTAASRSPRFLPRAVPWQTPGVCDALGRPEPCDCCGLLLWLPRCRSVWSGNGLRQTAPNPFVQHCQDKGGELLALELPGREARRAEKREVELQRYAAACRFTADAAEARFALEWLASCSLWPCNGFRSAELEIPSSCVCGVGSSCSCRCCPLGGDLRERLLFRVISGGTSAPLLQHVRPARHCAIQ